MTTQRIVTGIVRGLDSKTVIVEKCPYCGRKHEFTSFTKEDPTGKALLDINAPCSNYRLCIYIKVLPE